MNMSPYERAFLRCVIPSFIVGQFVALFIAVFLVVISGTSVATGVMAGWFFGGPASFYVAWRLAQRESRDR